jgi:tRNA nucleotidyltransferase (CCA-adding enzyme)
LLDWIPAELARLFEREALLEHAYLVGGCVRDQLLGLAVKDFDIEVYGVGYAELESALARHGRTNLVGRSFGVVKLTLPLGRTYDFTLPRRDSKVAPGHKGFEIEIEPALTPREAAARRDYTINALMVDPRRGEYLDFHGGRADLAARVLRHTSAAFADDPLRVLRGLQFCGRFGLSAAPETLELCRSIAATQAELARERIVEEWLKWAGASRVPSAGLVFLRDSGWLAGVPPLAALTPEAYARAGRGLDALVATARDAHGASGSSGARVEPPEAGERDARAALVFTLLGLELDGAAFGALHAALGLPAALAKHCSVLHGGREAFERARSAGDVRRLARDLEPGSIEQLARVLEAAHSGGAGASGETSTRRALLEHARRLGVSRGAPPPLVLGRHLLERGLAPGKAVGELLREAYEAQLDGAFADSSGALEWLAARLHPRP